VGAVEETRETVRARWHAAIPSWYSPWAHLAFPSTVGLTCIALALRAVHGVHALELAVVPLT